MEPAILGPEQPLLFFFFFLFPQGFFYAERQNFGMMLHGRWRWCLATNAVTSPSASGVLRASEWVGLYK